MPGPNDALTTLDWSSLEHFPGIDALGLKYSPSGRLSNNIEDRTLKGFLARSRELQGPNAGRFAIPGINPFNRGPQGPPAPVPAQNFDKLLETLNAQIAAQNQPAVTLSPNFAPDNSALLRALKANGR